MTHIQKGDYAFLESRLGKLDICVATCDNDGFIAYPTVEPLFCLERHSLDELTAAVGDVLTSYVSTFYHVDRVDVSATSEAIPSDFHRLPVEKVSRSSRLRPNFGNIDSPHGLLVACVIDSDVNF